MRIYPDTLPSPSWPSFVLTPADQSLRTDMEVGDPKTRRLTHARRDVCDLEHRMKDAEYGVFRAWFGDEPWSLTGESDAFTGWTEARVTLALDGFAVGPDGQPVWAISETAVTNTHILQRGLSGLVAADTTVVCRMTLKANGRDKVRLSLVNMANTSCVAVVDLATGQLMSSTNVLSAAVKDRGNGWYRVEFVAAMGSGATTPNFRATLSTDGTVTNYLGDGFSGVLATEQQLKLYTGYDLYLPTDASGNVQGASGGAGWFAMAVPVGGGNSVKQCQFIGTYAAAAMQGTNWSVKSKVRVR